MTNHPNRSRVISGTRTFVIGECTRLHDIAHDEAFSRPPHQRDTQLDRASAWSQAADWASNGGTERRLKVGGATYTIKITN
jgi:hypothetical protein